MEAIEKYGRLFWLLPQEKRKLCRKLINRATKIYYSYCFQALCFEDNGQWYPGEYQLTIDGTKLLKQIILSGIQEDKNQRQKKFDREFLPVITDIIEIMDKNSLYAVTFIKL